MAVPAMAADYDIVIKNGRVMDPETKLDAVRNVGIKNGRIEVVTDAEISGKETIDAEGLVVLAKHDSLARRHGRYCSLFGATSGFRPECISAIQGGSARSYF